MRVNKKKSLRLLMICCLLLWGAMQGMTAEAEGTSGEGNSQGSVTFYYGEKPPGKPGPENPKKPIAPGGNNKPGLLPQTGERKVTTTVIGLLCVGSSLTLLIMMRKRHHVYK